ncbi:hypothetical protein LIER_35261 [Lithospermum erythrorhizon]|uniref:Piriformospora indica-insensitive protein 2 n=1 Tax=Lithospermum erythrorhizon TaxID=34254 RepID=A0AAV3NQ05_LITER
MKATCIIHAKIIEFVAWLFFGLYIFQGIEATEDDHLLLSPMEKNEQEALYSAIQGFVGDGWNGTDLYPDPCGWTPIEGVSCDFSDDFWHVTELNIGSVYENSLGCSPNAEFRQQLFKLKYLKRLSFTNCFTSVRNQQVSLPISDWDYFANTLESLEFRSNSHLIGTIPATLGHLKNLQSLVLLENGLTGEIPRNVTDLIHLKRLVLAGNKFEGHIPTDIGKLNELLIIDGSRNKLSGQLPSTIWGLSSLIKLDLSNNLLQGTLPNELGYLKKLTLLDLSGNRFSGGFGKSLEGMVELQEMLLSDNPFGGDLMAIKWENLENLQYLDLSNTSLIGDVPYSLTRIMKLRFLGLSNNGLSGIIPFQDFEKLSNLNTLYLNGNNFTGRLGFSEEFYGKLGSRFRVYDNVNLCCMIDKKSSSKFIAREVKPCEQ